MSILITGGAGYIGSHTAHAFLDAGYDVVVIDDLSTGSQSLLPPKAIFYQGNIEDKGLLEKIFAHHAIDGVIHFAGSTVVPESIAKPAEYYRNNTMASLVLLQSCQNAGVRKLIFSSTAAVYGNNPLQLMKEDYEPHPETPYAASKHMTERMIADIAAVTDLKYIILRYFNVAGADPQGRTGQVTKNATHLIKVACEVALGKRPELHIFGTDYNTPDGTCLRDFIHVSDLADAHLKAYASLTTGAGNKIYNCGYGLGTSVRQVVTEVEKHVGSKIKVINASRRPGDPIALLADASLLKKETGWSPRYGNLEEIIKTAIAWERRLAEGS